MEEVIKNEESDYIINEIRENKIIANFVGLEINYIKCNHYQDPIEYEMEIHKIPNFLDHDNDLLYLYECEDGPIELHYQFHCNWKWLMGIVEQIENMRDKEGNYLFSIDTGRDYCYIKHNNFKQNLIAISSVHNDKKMSIYKAIIWFIEWYNNQDIKLIKE